MDQRDHTGRSARFHWRDRHKSPPIQPHSTYPVAVQREDPQWCEQAVPGFLREQTTRSDPNPGQTPVSHSPPTGAGAAFRRHISASGRSLRGTPNRQTRARTTTDRAAAGNAGSQRESAPTPTPRRHGPCKRARYRRRSGSLLPDLAAMVTEYPATPAPSLRLRRRTRATRRPLNSTAPPGWAGYRTPEPHDNRRGRFPRPAPAAPALRPSLLRSEEHTSE